MAYEIYAEQHWQPWGSYHDKRYLVYLQ